MSKLLIVVDMQNDFIDGALGTPQALEIVDSVNQKIKEYDGRGDLVIFTADTHGDDPGGTDSAGSSLYPGHPRLGNQRQPVSSSGFPCY